MRYAILATACLLITSFAEGAPFVRAPLPFHLTPHGGIVIPVEVDGAGPFPFLVDTGSSGSVVSESLAARLALPVVARTTSMSAVGRTTCVVARIGQLTLGDVSNADVLAVVAGLDVPDTALDGTRVQGIVGQDVLAAWRYTIDYRERRITWRDAPAEVPRRASVLALEARDDRFLVVLPQRHSTLRLVPDSGSEGLVLFQNRDAPSPLPLTSVSAARTAIAGIAGRADALQARVSTLRLGSATLIDYPAVVVTRDREGVSGGDGLLPLHIFARVTFNGPERQLIIEQR